MKKLLSALLSIVLVAMLAFPAFAEGGSEPIFETAFNLVDNEPTVEYDEWDIPYNVWNPIPDNTAINPGDTVTMVLSYTVPETVEGYDERLVYSIEYITEVNGVDDLTLFEAQGCPGRLECDYEIGICYPIAGEYQNAVLEGNSLHVMAELGSTVIVVLRGTAAGNEITGSTAVTIGQYRFPAQFSLCTVDKGEANGFPSYNAHWSDFFLVQKRAVEFRSEDGGVYTMYVARNNHYYRFIPSSNNLGDFIPVDENFEDVGELLDHDDSMYATLADILTQVVEFFDLTYIQTAFTDYDFIGEGEHYTFEYPFAFGGEAPVDPTDEPAPVDPTDEPVPVDPTEAPAEPTAEPAPSDPGVPSTGMISLCVFGACAAAAGAAALTARKKQK